MVVGAAAFMRGKSASALLESVSPLIMRFSAGKVFAFHYQVNGMPIALLDSHAQDHGHRIV